MGGIYSGNLILSKVITKGGKEIGYLFTAGINHIPVVKTDENGVMNKVFLSEGREIILGEKDMVTTLALGEYLGLCRDICKRNLLLYKKSDGSFYLDLYTPNAERLPYKDIDDSYKILSGVLRREYSEYPKSIEYLLKNKLGGD